uniref:DOT1 domain-containing protein n=1 Tax=Rhabditophanes sp. KR3021 TaxID=114890 RepID=A0AC35U9K1_9BILA
MNIEKAKAQFEKIVKSLPPIDKMLFAEHIKNCVDLTEKESEGCDVRVMQRNPKDLLQIFSNELRKIVPSEGIFESENIHFNTSGPDSDCIPFSTIHVDAFLYDDDMMDDMVENDEIRTYYCKNCKSDNVEKKTVISHSLSVLQLEYIFEYLLHAHCLIKDMSLLDLGSRMGGILYAANLYKAKKVSGIEICKEFVNTTNKIIKDLNPILEKDEDGNVNIHVLQKDILDCAETLRESNIVTANNVFSFFNEPTKQLNLWTFLFQNLKEGTIIVHNPELEKHTFAHLDPQFDLDQLIKPLNHLNASKRFTRDKRANAHEIMEIRIYKVVKTLGHVSKGNCYCQACHQ